MSRKNETGRQAGLVKQTEKQTKTKGKTRTEPRKSKDRQRQQYEWQEDKGTRPHRRMCRSSCLCRYLFIDYGTGKIKT